MVVGGVLAVAPSNAESQAVAPCALYDHAAEDNLRAVLRDAPREAHPWLTQEAVHVHAGLRTFPTLLREVLAAINGDRVHVRQVSATYVKLGEIRILV